MNHQLPSTEIDETAPGESWEQALAAVYDGSSAALILYGRALGLSHGEAEDVLQDVFAAMLQLTLRPEDPGAYATRAFRNRALNQRRSWWRRLTRELESRRWFEPADPISPQEAAAVRCLVRLPVEQREVIVLKLWHGRTFEEIARLQDVAANTAAGRYRYGLQKLRACLLERGPETENDHEHVSESRIDPGAYSFAATPAPARGPS